MKSKTTIMWQFKVGIKAIIAKFVCLWKCPSQINEPPQWTRTTGLLPQV